MSLSSLESRTLWLTVWHSDMFGRNDFLGEVTISLTGRVFDNPQPQWYLLQERVSYNMIFLIRKWQTSLTAPAQTEPFDDVTTYRGDIIVGLKYIPPETTTGSSSSTSRSVKYPSTANGGGGLNLRKFGSSMKSPASARSSSSSPTASPSSSSAAAAAVSGKGALHVLVKEGKNLTTVKANGSCDAFCKRYKCHLFFCRFEYA